MKKLLLIPAFISLVACSKSRSLSDLKMNVDKPADVEAKFGKPDSIARHSVFGITAEFWAYKQDSICLLFRNDILSEAQDHCYRGFKPTDSQKSAMDEEARRMADSISEALTRQLDNAMNEAAKPMPGIDDTQP